MNITVSRKYGNYVMSSGTVIVTTIMYFENKNDMLDYYKLNKNQLIENGFSSMQLERLEIKLEEKEEFCVDKYRARMEEE